jgi:hypothetical protein
MNINIKITHPSGTVMEVNIPVLDSAAVTMPSAPVTPDEPQAASEPAIPAADAPSTKSSDEVLEDLPYIAGAEAERFLRKLGLKSLACETTGEKRVGEDGEGDGRIGGTGERKEEGGEGEGGEENLEQFKCTDGLYSMPPNLYSDFCSAFGQTTVDLELMKARLWMDCNPTKRKTRRGMSRYLNAWLCRAQGEKRQSLKSRSGSLLEANNTSQKGW